MSPLINPNRTTNASTLKKTLKTKDLLAASTETASKVENSALNTDGPMRSC